MPHCRISERNRRAPKCLDIEEQSPSSHSVKSKSKKSSNSTTITKSKTKSAKSIKSSNARQKKDISAQSRINPFTIDKGLMFIDKSMEIINLSSDDDIELPSEILSVRDCSNSSSQIKVSIESIVTKVQIFKGRHMQGTAKQFNANLSLSLHEFQEKMLEIAKKKFDVKGCNLDVDALAIGYNWGSVKDPLKCPPATGLEDEEDYEGIIFISNI
jgi:hypothetical protein